METQRKRKKGKRREINEREGKETEQKGEL